jgi:hypothetical protein
VLSLGKLGAGQQRYYLEAVASGVEDYYSGRGEVMGRWVGAGVETLALSSVVDGDGLRAVLEGRDPETGVPLVRIRSDHVPGFDLTFRAPKSVSVLFGLSGFEVSAQVRGAHGQFSGSISAVSGCCGFFCESLKHSAWSADTWAAGRCVGGRSVDLPTRRWSPGRQGASGEPDVLFLSNALRRWEQGAGSANTQAISGAEGA